MCYICNDVLSRLKLWISFACKDNIILYIANNNGVNKFLGCMVWHSVFLSVPSCLKKVCHLMFFNNWQMWNDFHNSFTSWFIKKFSMYKSQNPPHLQYVATLPCESWKPKNVTYFDSILNKLLTCSWGHFEHLIEQTVSRLRLLTVRD